MKPIAETVRNLIEQRDAAIYAARLAGKDTIWLARKFGVSRRRVYQIYWKMARKAAAPAAPVAVEQSIEVKNGEH